MILGGSIIFVISELGGGLEVPPVPELGGGLEEQFSFFSLQNKDSMIATLKL